MINKQGLNSQIFLIYLLSFSFFCILLTAKNTYAATTVKFVPSITAVWANEGGDKVTQSELRSSSHTGGAVINHIWSGSKIKIKGAKNEVVNFNLVLESPKKLANQVQVSFDTLSGPSGNLIKSQLHSDLDIFNWVDRPIELFYVRYLQIKGLSHFGFENYDERHVPKRMELPWNGSGYANSNATWNDRPDHDKFYPEIAVPLELVPIFNINAGQNQSIWVDIYIPKTVIAGTYTGTIRITESGNLVKNVPVELVVYPFALPDVPTAKTMVVYSSANVNERFTGTKQAPLAQKNYAKLIQDRYFLIAHRHKISLIGDGSNIEGEPSVVDQPGAFFASRLRGSFFSTSNGYDGPGKNVGNNVYSVGTYGAWNFGDTQANMQAHSDNWVNWFDKNAPGVDYFLYLADESSNYSQTETWASWLANNPGPGNRLKSMATINLLTAVKNTPSLQIPTTTFGVGIPSQWETVVNQYTHSTNKQFFMYNGTRPGTGSFMTEDDGVALRQLAWAQFKKNINRWFYWESTYYDDFQGGGGKKNLFQTAATFGINSSPDPIRGESGKGYSNGDGVLFYPGTDLLYPQDSYNADGPIVSLRLKYWRRGIQDNDYLALAQKICPTSVPKIVQRMVPKVLWEYGVSDITDPTWVRSPISWSLNPDTWETTREELADIITKKRTCAKSF